VYVKIIASRRWDVFETRCVYTGACAARNAADDKAYGVLSTIKRTVTLITSPQMLI